MRSIGLWPPRSDQFESMVSAMSTTVKFQALPPLSPDEYRDLEESVLQHGVLVPIIVDEDGVVIDGHHRQKICREHDLPCPREVKGGFTDTEKRTLALSLNLDRRHLSREQRRALVAESIKADPQLSNRQHGDRVGVDHKTAGKVRRDLESSGEIPQSDKRVSADGRARPASQPAKPPRPEPRPRRKPITDEASGIALDLSKIIKRLTKLADDDRFDRSSDAIGDTIRPHVDHGLEVLQRLHVGINPQGPADVLPAIIETLKATVVACHFPQIDKLDRSVVTQNVGEIRSCLDAINDLIEQWGVK
jgi:ParB-like chromosome segregation protein Spo0J